MLRAEGVNRFVVVVGHKSEVVREFLATQAGEIEIVSNDDWATTNSAYSMWLGLSRVTEPTWTLECDVAFEGAVLCGRTSHSVNWLVDSSMRQMDGSFVRADAAGNLESIRIERDLARVNVGDAKSVGILCMDRAGRDRLMGVLQDVTEPGRQRDYYDVLVAQRLPMQGFGCADIAGLRWFEIDSPADLVRAEELLR